MALQTYSIALFAGGSTNPQTLLPLARTFLALSDAELTAIATYIICRYRAVASGFDCSIQNVETNSVAFAALARDELTAAELWLWTQVNTSSTDPATLLGLARSFMRLDHHTHLAMQAYCLCTALPVGPTCTAAVLAVAAKDYYKLSDLECQMARVWLLCQIGAAGNIPTPTGFTFTIDSTFSTITTSWDVVPAGVTKTEIWTSTDNVTFALEATINAPTHTTTVITIPAVTKYAQIRYCNATSCGSFTSVLSVTVTIVSDWAAQVVANGGAAPSAATQTAVQTFWNSIYTIRSQIICLNFFAADNLTACLTPFIKGPGSSPWTNHNFVAGDLSVSGLQGTGGAATKWLGTGITTNQIQAISPGRIGIEYGVIGFGINIFDSGTYDGVNGNSAIFLSQWANGPVCQMDIYGAGDDAPPANTVGFCGGERTSLSLQTNHHYNNIPPYTYSSNVVNTGTVTPSYNNFEFYVFAANGGGGTPGAPGNCSPRKIMWWSCTTGLNAADFQTLAVAGNILRQAIGGSW